MMQADPDKCGARTAAFLNRDPLLHGLEVLEPTTLLRCSIVSMTMRFVKQGEASKSSDRRHDELPGGSQLNKDRPSLLRDGVSAWENTLNRVLEGLAQEIRSAVSFFSCRCCYDKAAA